MHVWMDGSSNGKVKLEAFVRFIWSQKMRKGRPQVALALVDCWIAGLVDAVAFRNFISETLHSLVMRRQLNLTKKKMVQGHCLLFQQVITAVSKVLQGPFSIDDSMSIV